MVALITQTVVVDTNTLLRGIVRPDSALGRVVGACQDRRLKLLLSRPILEEYRRILAIEQVRSRRPDFTAEKVESFLNELRFYADSLRRIAVTFDLPRDPRDAMFVELAIAGRATHIITHDADLLSLPVSRTDAGKRFRQRCRGVRILDAVAFAAELPHLVR
jgi:putative PIN family toxin of toxin-antitoxin system